MKIFLETRRGGKFEFEWTLEPYKFYSLVWGTVLCVVAVAFFGIFK